MFLHSGRGTLPGAPIFPLSPRGPQLPGGPLLPSLPGSPGSPDKHTQLLLIVMQNQKNLFFWCLTRLHISRLHDRERQHASMSVMLKTIFGTQSEVHILHGLPHSVGREDLGLVVPAVSVKAGDD